MAYKSLRDFITKLEAEGELLRVTEQVSTDLEMTAFHKEMLQRGGPAILFENVVNERGEKSDMPVLVNLFGTVRRVAMAVTFGGKERRTGDELRDVGETLAFLRQPEPPQGLKDAMDRGTIGVLTLCLTPDSYTPGWAATEALAARILERLDLAFQLPDVVEPM